MSIIARPRNPNRDKAFEIYKENEGKIKIVNIAKILEEKESNIRSWKKNDGWDNALGIKRKKGGQKNNKNAVGNNGGAPIGNLNGLRTGEYLSNDRFIEGLPALTKKTIQNNVYSYTHLELLWMHIQVQSARIITMQKIAHVKNKKDITKELKKVSKGNTNSTEYEIQFAWDKENSNMTALSRAMTAVTKMIETYDKMIHANWDLVTEEKKLRIEVLKSKLGVKDNSNNKSISKLDSILAEIKK